MLCALMLDWHLGMVETIDGRPCPLGAADALTLVRAWLVPVAWQHPSARVYALAAVSDTLDGPLARRSEPTRAGRDLEGLVDACFAISALHGAREQDLIARSAFRAESVRIAIGMLYGSSAYFIGIAAPNETLLRAARPLSALRMCGLLLAGTGRRRPASFLVGGGAIASTGVGIAAMLSLTRSEGTGS